MARTVKHFSLHRIAGACPEPGPELSRRVSEGTELRVVADVESGVLPLIQAEETVIRGYTGTEFRNSQPVLSPAEVSEIRISRWPHRWVTLFVLQDLQPLIRQLRPGANLPPGGAAALDYRPVVNVYDLADLAGCHIFINRQAMVQEGYWDDPLAAQGLLAHEHAHPLAENETTRASRQLRFSIADCRLPIAHSGIENRRPVLSGAEGSKTCPERSRRIENLLSLLADKLCLYAPREVFANEMAICSGFGGALLHLDRCNVTNAARSVAGRQGLQQQLQAEVASGNLTPQVADLLLLIGDLKGYLDLALEVSSFYRAGQEVAARELDADLEAAVFSRLEPGVARAYTALQEQYTALRPDLTPPALIVWGEGVLSILAEALAEKGLILRYRLWMAEG